MLRIYSLNELESSFDRSEEDSSLAPNMRLAMALGNFDGLHLGHCALLAKTYELAKNEPNLLSAVMTFAPHPARFFNPSLPPTSLMQSQQKADMCESLGIDAYVNLPFNSELAHTSAEDFITEILVKKARVAHVIIGDDFIFGHQRQGNAALLRQWAAKGVFALHQIPSVNLPVGGRGDQNECSENSSSRVSGDLQRISSTRIRQALHSGQVESATAMLGRPWTIEGTVVPGDQRGRDLGARTANIELGEYLHPRYGVYVVCAYYEGKRYSGVANCGVRPSFDDSSAARLEVHLLDASLDLYGKSIRVEFLHFIRDEMTFETSEALMKQIQHDISEAKAVFSRVGLSD